MLNLNKLPGPIQLNRQHTHLLHFVRRESISAVMMSLGALRTSGFRLGKMGSLWNSLEQPEGTKHLVHQASPM